MPTSEIPQCTVIDDISDLPEGTPAEVFASIKRVELWNHLESRRSDHPTLDLEASYRKSLESYPYTFLVLRKAS